MSRPSGLTNSRLQETMRRDRNIPIERLLRVRQNVGKILYSAHLPEVNIFLY